MALYTFNSIIFFFHCTKFETHTWKSVGNTKLFTIAWTLYTALHRSNFFFPSEMQLGRTACAGKEGPAHSRQYFTYARGCPLVGVSDVFGSYVVEGGAEAGATPAGIFHCCSCNMFCASACFLCRSSSHCIRCIVRCLVGRNGL